jgi:hypothetical protein
MIQAAKPAMTASIKVASRALKQLAFQEPPGKLHFLHRLPFGTVSPHTMGNSSKQLFLKARDERS